MLAGEEVIEKMWGVTLDRLYDSTEGQRILSCIQCGTCAGSCPYGEHMLYTPRRIITMLKAGLIEEVFESDSQLKCVNCYTCMTKCPRSIRLTEILLPLVKEQTAVRLEEMPAELQRAIESTYRYGNSYGESARKRTAWLDTTDVPVRMFGKDSGPADYLWFVECDLSYHPRGQDAARATAMLFYLLDIDFAILGPEERCAGDCGRLSWEPGLAETLIDYNLSIFEKYQFNQIVTNDPHALDAFRFRYPEFDFQNKTISTVRLLASHLERLAPMLTKSFDYTITYHDSCCLGRHNGIYDEPRALLNAIPGVRLVEMAHNRENALCCGGGGGGMWLDTYYKSQNMERLSDRRLKEVIATGADVLAVACPYEVPRFEDAVKLAGYEDRIKVRDITELLVEAIGGY
jgi:Fe-S oxidoreductase